MKLIKVYRVYSERYVYLTTGKISFVYRTSSHWQGTTLKLQTYGIETLTVAILSLNSKSLYDSHLVPATKVNLDTAQIEIYRT